MSLFLLALSKSFCNQFPADLSPTKITACIWTTLTQKNKGR